jgi:hypothetical protein
MISRFDLKEFLYRFHRLFEIESTMEHGFLADLYFIIKINNELD